MMKKISVLLLILLSIVGCSNHDVQKDKTSKEIEDKTIINDNTSEEGTTKDDDHDESNSSKDDNQEEGQDAYIQRLIEEESNLAPLVEKSENGTQTEMNEAAQEIYQEWDKLLNEIYGVLESQLSTEKMAELREEQLKWIEERDTTAKVESEKYQGGTLEAYVYAITMADLTKARCYDLVEHYME
jgi:uncharacterized protein YecT (DUF1311 family)